MKICGVTNESEIASLEQWGVDYFGLVVDVQSPWTITAECGAATGKIAIPPDAGNTRHGGRNAAEIGKLGARNRRSGNSTRPWKHAGSRRRAARNVGPGRVLIVQEITHSGGSFIGEQRLEEFIEAGVDLILLDKRHLAEGDNSPPGTTIPAADLMSFRQRNPGVPVLVAGGVSVGNARALIEASGAVGIDVCSSVHRAGSIDDAMVGQLMRQIASE